VHTYELSLFGGFELRDDQGTPLAVQVKKSRCLLTYLALAEGQPIRRDHLAHLLWGERPENRARHSLSQELYRLRQVFSEDARTEFQLSAESVSLACNLLDVDVIRFERNLDSGETKTIEDAASLYDNDVMAGLDVGEEGFDEWLWTERERLRDRAIVAWRGLLQAQVDGPAERAIESATQLLAIEPTDEEAHRILMQLYAHSGRRDLALRQYERCKEVLSAELEIEPEAQTRELYERLKAEWRTTTAGATTSAASESTAVIGAGTDRQSPVALPAFDDRPSLAVLPFRNMSDSAENEYLADGLAEDLTTLLARIPGFCVISSISSFSYKDQSPGARQIGHDLQARYLVRGSLRPLGERLRLTIELVDTGSGRQIWAERFDRSAEWLASLQDELTTSIVAQIEPELAGAEVGRVSTRRTKDPGAWALYHKSLHLARQGWREDVLLDAIATLRRAIVAEPEFALGHARLALLLAIGHLLGHVDALDEAQEAAERAIALGPDSSEALSNAGCALLDIGQGRRAADLLERAIELNPSNAQAWVILGCCHLASARYDEAIQNLSYGLRISPRDPRIAIWMGVYARALERGGRLEDALAQAREACKLDARHHGPRVVLALLMLRAGRVNEARAALTDARRVRPALTMREAAGLIGKDAALSLRAIW
jgi:DNA-binding SARP family transcriptional activator